MFCDSFHELNGVGTVSREFAAFAQKAELPFCCIHSGPKTKVSQRGLMTCIELKRGITFPLDKDLDCDPFLSRYRNFVMRQLQEFRPDLIQITGPGDMGVLGFWISNLIGVPLAASWHTNLHEYASRRIYKSLGFAPDRLRHRAAAFTEHLSLSALTAYYRLAHFVLAPNAAMVTLLGELTGRPAYKMKHGVDTSRFSARQKTSNGKFRIGWVGRLTPEKNVRVFAEIERQLLSAGERDFEMLLVGDGSERSWLKAHLRSAALPGSLKGYELSQAFASMDAFVFPSRTDTFGLVILEAMASGVPVVLSSEAGARVGIRHGTEGFVSDSFTEGVLELMRSSALRERMGKASECFAQSQTWKGVFEDLYDTYRVALEHPEVRRRMRQPAPVKTQ